MLRTKNRLHNPNSAQAGTCCKPPSMLQDKIDWYFGERLKDHNGGHILKGAMPTQDDVCLTSNDYLSIADHPQITQAISESAESSEASVLMSGVFLHGDCPQRRFESNFAHFVGQQDALISQSGYSANVGLIQSINEDGSLPVYLDMYSHMSLQEGAQSAGAKFYKFKHNSASSLARQIRKHGPGIIAIDSLYSTQGSIAPILEFVQVAEANDCVLIVDESHSVGCYGHQGQGLVSALGLSQRVHFITVSLAKTFASRAGIIACNTELAEFVKYNSRPAIFSSALLDREFAALEKTLEIIRVGRDRRALLHANADYLRRGITALGYNIDCSDSQIIPLVSGEERRTILLRDALEKRGVFGSVFCAPATPMKHSLVRLTVNVRHSKEELQRVIDVLEEIKDEVEFDQWPGHRKTSTQEGRAKSQPSKQVPNSQRLLNAQSLSNQKTTHSGFVRAA